MRKPIAFSYLEGIQKQQHLAKMVFNISFLKTVFLSHLFLIFVLNFNNVMSFDSKVFNIRKFK